MLINIMNLSPFAYFVKNEWPFFVLALITYLVVYSLTAYKSFWKM